MAVLTLGWSVLEGLGAALVLPAMVALIAGNFEGASRKVAYAVIGGVAGAGIAVGPILGGWATTEYSWRIIFAGEVLLVALILVMTPKVADAVRTGPAPKLDIVGSVLSAAGLGLVVLGVLQSSTWGWVKPKEDSPVTPFGFSLTVFVIGFGAVLLWAFTAWQGRRESSGRDPLVHLALLKIAPLRSGLIGLFSQNLILMGVFFTIPLYLQLVIGLDALETGLKMLPVSIAMFLASAAGSRLSGRYPIRSIVRAGLATAMVATVMLLATIEPELDNSSFAWSMAVLGVGMGLIASQLGNVVQSSVDASGRGEAGGLQFTGQQLGSSVGVALLGAIVLSGLTTRVRVQHLGRRADQQCGLRAGRRGRRVRNRLRVGRPDRSRCPGGGAGRADHRGARRGLRVRTAASAQDRAAGSGLPGPALPGLHQGSAARGAQTMQEAGGVPGAGTGRLAEPAQEDEGGSMMEISRGQAWRIGLLVALRTTASVSALFAAYFLIPTRSADDGPDLPWLLLELCVFAVIVGIQVPAIVKAKYPILRAVETLAVLVPLYLLLFARIYLSNSLNDQSAFTRTSQPRSRPCTSRSPCSPASASETSTPRPTACGCW